ncbi:MAG: asparagine--tRNA ligase [Chloroflexota bacterium]|nr:asparagine--tRNA ligase [Chloroflexota bacterium]MDQ5866764.1 asparagine--tRNA ligase [Chloroflexota bacterium]
MQTEETTTRQAPVVYIADLKDHDGQLVTVRGWLMHHRDKKKLQFLVLRDGTGTVQAVAFIDDMPAEAWEKIGQLTQESSVMVTGTVRKDERAPGGYEISVKDLDVFQVAGADFPIANKEHGVGFLMEHRHLWLRSNKQRAVLRIRAEVVKAVRDYLDDHGYVLVDTPILTPAACEGTSTLFETDYFGTPAYLAQSGQLYNEADIFAFGKVYCFGPTFRAEKSKTRRHLMEFWMVEPEAAWMELDGLIELEQSFVSYIVQTVLEKRRVELELLERDTSKLEKVLEPFPRITYDRALEILRENGLEVQWGDDFGGDEETVLASQYDRPLFITHYPAHAKAFYMQPDPQRPEVVLCADLIAPEGYGEICGGSQRIHDVALLEQRIVEHNLPREAFEWYLELRRYGSVPHSGFGMGIERVVGWICGVPHLRETIPFPRMLDKIYP